MSARKELIAFVVVAAAALGSILSFALTSHRREAQTSPGTLVRAAAVAGICPAELTVRHGTKPPQICAADCAPVQTSGQCDCEIQLERCRDADAR